MNPIVKCFKNASFVSLFLFAGNFQIFVRKFLVHLWMVNISLQKRARPLNQVIISLLHSTIKIYLASPSLFGTLYWELEVVAKSVSGFDSTTCPGNTQSFGGCLQTEQWPSRLDLGPIVDIIVLQCQVVFLQSRIVTTPCNDALTLFLLYA